MARALPLLEVNWGDGEGGPRRRRPPSRVPGGHLDERGTQGPSVSVIVARAAFNRWSPRPRTRERRHQAGERLSNLVPDSIPGVGAVADAISDPWDVHVGQEIEIGAAGACRRRSRAGRRRSAGRVDHGAHQIRVEKEVAGRVLCGGGERRVFGSDLGPRTGSTSSAVKGRPTRIA